MGVFSLAQSCGCSGLDDSIAGMILGRLAPRDVDVGPGTISLEQACFLDDNDNVDIDGWDDFDIVDVVLTGSAVIDVPIVGSIGGIEITILVDIHKVSGQPATVDVKDIECISTEDMVNEMLADYSVKQAIMQAIEDAVNEVIDGE